VQDGGEVTFDYLETCNSNHNPLENRFRGIRSLCAQTVILLCYCSSNRSNALDLYLRAAQFESRSGHGWRLFGTTVTLLGTVLVELPHLKSVKPYITAVSKNSVGFEWIRSIRSSLKISGW
jgi:hypothetical protein